MARLSRDDWFRAAAHVLSESGGTGLTVDALTAAAGVTKGSFYHHFGNYDGFVQAFIDYFEVAGFGSVVEGIDETTSAREQLTQLFDVIARRNYGQEFAARRWGVMNAAVGEALGKLDSKRLEYVTSLCARIIEPTSDAPQVAQRYARAMLALYIGGISMHPQMTPSEVRSIPSLVLAAQSDVRSGAFGEQGQTLAQ